MGQLATVARILGIILTAAMLPQFANAQGVAPGDGDLAIAKITQSSLYTKGWAPSVPQRNRGLDGCLSAMMDNRPLTLANRCSFPILVSLTYGESNFRAECVPQGTVTQVRIDGSRAFVVMNDSGFKRDGRRRQACVTQVDHLALAEPTNRPGSAKAAQAAFGPLVGQDKAEITIRGHAADGASWILRRRIAAVSQPDPCSTKLTTSATTFVTPNLDRSRPIAGEVTVSWREIAAISLSDDRISLKTAADTSWDASYEFRFSSAAAAREAAAPIEALTLRC